MTVENFVKHNYPALALILWFGSLTVFFAPMPQFLVWFYILFFPVLMLYDLFRRYHQQSLKLQIGLIDISLFFYILFAVNSLLSNTDLPLSRSAYLTEFLFRTFSPFTVYWFIRVNPLKQSHLRLLAYFFAFIIVFESIFGIISLFFPLVLPETYQPRPAHLYRRATGKFVTP